MTMSDPEAGPTPSDPIWSHEGLSGDQLTRARVNFLVGQNRALIQQTQFADTKAGALLTLLGVLAARSAVDFSAAGALTPFLIALFAVKALLVLACLMVLAPRVPSATLAKAIAEKEKFSWVALSSGIDGDAFTNFMRVSQASDLVESLSRCNVAMSVILKRKFSILRAAFLIALVDVVGTIAGYLLVLRD